jgi:hypothetical protein
MKKIKFRIWIEGTLVDNINYKMDLDITKREGRYNECSILQEFTKDE